MSNSKIIHHKAFKINNAYYVKILFENNIVFYILFNITKDSKDSKDISEFVMSLNNCYGLMICDRFRSYEISAEEYETAKKMLILE